MEFKLIIKKINDNLSPDEASIFDTWYNESASNRDYFHRVSNNFERDIDTVDVDAAWKSVTKKITPKKSKKSYYKYAIAASLIVMISATYFNYTTKKQQTIVESKPTEGVTLTLSDGTTVVLSDHKNGVIANQENAVITKDQDGQIRYNDNTSTNTGKIAYNTLVTANGKTFQITLPDGTNVWMNAGSSLKFPTYFSGIERAVILTGEAYFEVAHNPKMPFKVFSKGQEVEVLGTHFNVKAYLNEPNIKTALLEGKIKITEGDNSSVLKPGQQAFVNTNQHLIQVSEANLESSVAWKNRLFYFENAKCDEIMREIERWYDVEVIYKGKIPDERFQGAIQKDLKLNQVLKMLESKDVHFKVQGKEVIVTQ